MNPNLSHAQYAQILGGRKSKEMIMRSDDRIQAKHFRAGGSGGRAPMRMTDYGLRTQDLHTIARACQN